LYVTFALFFQAIDAFDDLFIQVLIELHHFFIYAHQFLLARLLVDMRDDIERKVQDTFQVTRREIQQKTNTARCSLKVPDMTHRGSEFDVSHALAAHL